MSDLHYQGHIMVMYNMVALATLVTLVLHDGASLQERRELNG